MSAFKQIFRRFYILMVLGFLLIGSLAIFENVHLVTGQGSWWDANWRYRKIITIDHTKVSAALTDFPVLINITDPDLTSKAQNDGDDIVFTDSSLVKLNHEIEFYNNNTGLLVAWVKANLSSTTDTVLQMYYGNPSASNQQNPTSAWDSNFVMVQHLSETSAPTSPADWHKYEGNPILNGSTDGFASVFYDSDSGIYHLFCSWGSILHYTSSDGKTGWTADPNNPVLSGNNEGVPMAWKEDGVWYMLYRYGGPDKIGLANSTDASHWTRYEGNPVINVGSFCDPWGVIKVGSTYYLWYNDGWGTGSRSAGLATSTDLKTWTQDSNNPIFTGGRYCIFPFKYGSYYYMLVPKYTSGAYGVVELYRCSSPTFYSSQREYLGVVINPGVAGSWDQYRFDTPCVLTDTIYRDTYTAANNELWTYYASTPDSGGKWWTGICIEQNITDALARFSQPTPYSHLDSTVNNNDGKRGGNLNMNVTGKIDGADYFTAATLDYINCGDSNSLKGMNALTVEGWVNLASLPSAGTGIVSKWSSSTSGSYLIWQGSAGTVNWGVITSSWKTTASPTALTTGQWYHLVGVYDGSQMRLYINGGQVGSISQTGTVMSEITPCYIGRYTTPYWNGMIDEVRISNASRSASWITTEYNNQLNPSTFYTLGTEEAREAKVCISPSLTEKTHGDIGTIFDVNVTIQDVKDMWGFEFNFTWDSTLITLMEVEFNTTLDSIWGYGKWFLASNNTSVGSYKLAAVSLQNGFNSTGIHTLATLTFRIEDPHSNFLRETIIHFATHKLSDSIPQPIDHTVQDGTYKISGEKPSLNLNPTTETCRTYGETFTVGVRASQVFNVTDFEFEIHFNTTLLDYSSINWNAWGTGSVIVDEVGGNVTGFTSGSLLSGDQTLITIEFKAALYHIWKNLPGWINDQSGTIYIRWANLSYASKPDLGYVKGGLNEIEVGPDVAYTFSPIQGDIDNDGNVDIMDLRTIAAFYDQVNTTYNLTGDAVVDIFDLVVIGSNFGFTYAP